MFGFLKGKTHPTHGAGLVPDHGGGNDAGRPTRGQMLKLQTAVDSASTALMMVDRDFVVTFVNKATATMLEKYQAEFRKVWPNFDPKAIIGSCIDAFHRNPEHQRRLLADPSRLPYRTDISVGEIKFSLCVNATYDEHGTYDGNVLEWADVTKQRQNEGELAAIHRTQAVIEFKLDGTIVQANDNFLNAMGYTLDEIRGQHHRLFVAPELRDSAEYRQFWERLGRGEFDAGQYQRFGKGGREVWIQASYNPILDQNGRAFKVVKYATDVTAQVQASRALQAAVEETQGVVNAAQNGDLTRRVPLAGKSGSIADLCSGVNSIVEAMAMVVAQVKEAASAIKTASREISQGNSDLSSRTESQASSLEETASSMEQLTSTVKQNADNARQANQLAAGASSVAVQGGEVVREVVTTMSEISESSKKIADIIGVIDSIAFQTNILALNAAVEAARAGEQGRGFAVVATEVRNLAQRSASAAKEIKTLISDSVDRVHLGSELVGKAGATMKEIVASVGRVTAIMAEIASASQEQSSGIEQINLAVSQMDEVTQQNAALVEEAAAAAESLEEQANSLVGSVEMFRVAQDDGAFDAPPPPPRAAPRPTQKVSPLRGAARAAKSKPPAASQAAIDDWSEF